MPQFAPAHDDATWLALSDHGLLAECDANDLINRGLLVLEFTLPLHPGQVLLNHQANRGWPSGLQLFADPEAGLVLLHRQGRSLVRHVLPGPLPQGRGTARISFGFDAPARQWSLTYEIPGAEAGSHHVATGQNPLPFPVADISALCAAPNIGAATDPAAGQVLWFGLTRSTTLPGAGAWIGQRSLVETSLGPVAAGNLKPGDILLTADAGPLPLRAVTRLHLPARGSFAPVLLRAPFFSSTQDLLVSADQMVAVGGPETEYLFGEEAVLMPAGALLDARTALSDQRRAVSGSVQLDLGMPALIACDGCLLSSRTGPGQKLPLRGLQPYEVLTLMTLLGRMPRRAA